MEGGREAASGGRRGEGGAFTVTDAGEAGEGVPPYAPSDADGVGHAGVVGEDAEGGAALDGSPPRRSRRGSHEPDSATAAALLAAVQEKDAKILKLISQNDELRRQNKDLSADVDDFEAELARVTAERDRAKKKEDSLEKQIKDAYSEVGRHQRVFLLWHAHVRMWLGLCMCVCVCMSIITGCSGACAFGDVGAGAGETQPRLHHSAGV